MKYVYVAGPYRGDEEYNTVKAMEVGSELVRLGFWPFVPHVNAHYWHSLFRVKLWMEYDLAWLARCDVVVRMPGRSVGADEEVEEARRLGIPVVYSVEELIKLSQKKEEDK